MIVLCPVFQKLLWLYNLFVGHIFCLGFWVLLLATVESTFKTIEPSRRIDRWVSGLRTVSDLWNIARAKHLSLLNVIWASDGSSASFLPFTLTTEMWRNVSNVSFVIETSCLNQLRLPIKDDNPTKKDLVFHVRWTKQQLVHDVSLTCFLSEWVCIHTNNKHKDWSKQCKHTHFIGSCSQTQKVTCREWYKCICLFMKIQ